MPLLEFLHNVHHGVVVLDNDIEVRIRPVLLEYDEFELKILVSLVFDGYKWLA